MALMSVKPTNQVAQRLRQLNTCSTYKGEMRPSSGAGSEALSIGLELDLVSSAFYSAAVKGKVMSSLLSFTHIRLNWAKLLVVSSTN